MASGRQEQELGIPQWKKDLLLRRRTLTRAITSGTGAVKLRVSCPTVLRSDSVPLVQSYGKHLPWQASHQPDFHPDSPVRTTMRFLDQDLSSSELIAIKCSSNSDSDLKPKMVEEKPDKKPSFRSMEKTKEDKHSKSFINNKMKRDDEDYHSDSSEELQYGPGIVNKLKSKYLSMTLRDNQKHSARPSLANLRRATSLENMLDDDSNRLQQKPHFIKKPYHSSTYRSSKISQHHAKYLGLTRGSESMKRARSMDTLLKSDNKNSFNQISSPTLPKGGFSNGIITPSIINEDIIIVDNSPETVEEDNKQPAKSEDAELPPHDLVKQTLKIFETTANNKPPTEVKSKVKTAVSKISNNIRPNSIENLSVKSSKPSLSPKPVLSPEKRFSRTKISSPKRVFPVVSSIEKPKPIVIAPKVLGPVAEPKKFSNPKISPKVSPTVEAKKIVNTSPVRSNNAKTTQQEVPINSTPVSSQKAPDSERLSISPVNSPDSDLSPEEDKPKYISQKARDGISKEGMSMKFSFNDKPILSDKSYLPRTVPQATNTALISSQGENSPVKQVAVIRPVVKNKVLTEQEIEKNHINKVKSVESNKIVKSDDTSVSDRPQLWEKKTWQSQNTMVFNFSDRKSVPDYIENDGISLANRKGTKCNGEETDGGGSGEEDWDPPLTCNVRFVGDNILINGKSSLKKEPRPSKLRIQFNDEATTTFEYPSEESMSEEAPSTPTPTQTPNPLTLGGGTLSSYTPSKSVAGEKFELGVTRTSALNFNNQESSSETPVSENKEDEYLKPVDPDEVNPWSHDTTTDMLF